MLTFYIAWESHAIMKAWRGKWLSCFFCVRRGYSLRIFYSCIVLYLSPVTYPDVKIMVGMKG